MRIVHSTKAGGNEVDSVGPLSLNVLFTSTSATIAAIKIAGKLSDELGARIRVIVPQIVPFQLPLSEPPVKPEFTAQRIQGILSSCPVNVEVQVCLCRERLDAAICVLAPHSVVVIGGRRQFWRTEEDRLAHELRQRGHDVVFVEPA